MTEELKIIITAEIDKLKQELNDVKKQVENVEKKGKSGFGNFNDAVQKAGAASTKVLKTVAVSIAGVATALLALGANSEEYRVSQAQLTTTFETAGASAEVAKQTYTDLYRVLGDNGQATEAAQHLAQLSTNQKDLSQWTEICQGVYATFGASLPIESLTEAANETAKTGELTGALADALNWAGISEADFAAQLLLCNNEAEREKLIRETLSGVYTDAAKGYEKNAKSVLKQHEAEVKLNDAMAALGEAIAPINTMLAEFAAQILTQVSPAVQSFANEHGKQIEKVLTDIAEAIGKVIGWISDNWDLISKLAPIILGIVAAVSAFSAIMSVVNAVMAASPVTWIVLGIVAALAALVAGIVLVVKNWDTIKAKTAQIWNAIKNTISTVVNGIVDTVKNVFSKVVDFVTAPFKKAKDAVGKIINGIKNLFNFNWSLPKLKVPKFTVKPAGWQIGDLLKGSIPKLGITWNAEGGVFDKPTLFGYGNSLQGIGENGAEAVVPLENNLGWLDKIAGMLADRMGVGTPIVLQVDGKVFAQTAVKSINNLTRQQGKLSLNLV